MKLSYILSLYSIKDYDSEDVETTKLSPTLRRIITALLILGVFVGLSLTALGTWKLIDSSLQWNKGITKDTSLLLCYYSILFLNLTLV